MRKWSLRREALTTKSSLLLTILPREVLVLIISKLENLKDVVNIANVSRFFTNDAYYCILTASMRIRVGNFSNDLKTLLHIERAKKGILLKAFRINSWKVHKDVNVRPNEPIINFLIGRSHDKFINDISISRTHGFIEIFEDYNSYKNGCLGKFHVTGTNGIFIEKEKVYKSYPHSVSQYYKRGRAVELFEGDIIHLSRGTGFAYKVMYSNY